MSTTARLALPYPELTDGPDGADVPYWVKALAEAADGLAPIDQGNLSARPTSTVGTPGIAGRFYISLDQSPKQVDLDLGTSWLTIFPIATGIADGSITTAKLADSSVTSAKIADGTIATADIAAKAITAALIADALKPSVSAGAGTEALRAIGASAGQVVAGNDSRLAIISNGSTGTGGTAAVLADSPALTGTPTAPTAAVDTTTTQLATTEFVVGQASQTSDGTPAVAGTAARGTSKHYARADHVHPRDTTKASLAGDTFTGQVVFQGAPSVLLEGTAPIARWHETDAATDETYWQLFSASGTIIGELLSDDRANNTHFMHVARTGYVPTAIDFVNAPLRNKGMNVLRHADSTHDQHVESGTVGGVSTSTPVSGTFTHAFASTPIAVPDNGNGVSCYISALSTTGLTIAASTWASGSGSGRYIVKGVSS